MLVANGLVSGVEYFVAVDFPNKKRIVLSRILRPANTTRSNPIKDIRDLVGCFSLGFLFKISCRLWQRTVSCLVVKVGLVGLSKSERTKILPEPILE